MSSHYDINLDNGLVTIKNSASTPLTEAWQVARQLLDDPRHDSSLPHLVDLRDLVVTHTAAERDTFVKFMLDEFHPGVEASVAILVNDSLDRQALAGLYRIVSNLDKTELFDEYDLAIRWLIRREFAGTDPADGSCEQQANA